MSKQKDIKTSSGGSIRFTFTISLESAKRLRASSHRTGIPIAETLRRLVTKFLESDCKHK